MRTSDLSIYHLKVKQAEAKEKRKLKREALFTPPAESKKKEKGTKILYLICQYRSCYGAGMVAIFVSP